MRLASAIAARQQRYIAGHVAILRSALLDGRGLFYAFDAEDGTSTRVEVMGPRGMRGGGDDAGMLVAPVPTVRLWSPGAQARPLAVAAANRNFSEGLDVLAKRARPLVGDEFAVLLALVATIKEAAPRLRPRMPKVPMAFTTSGAPSVSAFASCLGLGDLEESIVRAVA